MNSKQLREFVKGGFSKVIKDSATFEKNHLHNKQKISDFQKEMDEWNKKNKIIRNK